MNNKNADKMERITAILPAELLDKLDNLKWDMKMNRMEFIRAAITEKVEDLELEDKDIQKAYICKRCGYASTDKCKVEECARSHPDEDTVKMHYEPHISAPDTITVQRGKDTLIFFFDNERTAEVNLHNDAPTLKSIALKEARSRHTGRKKI